jgi:hypothetical protein
MTLTRWFELMDRARSTMNSRPLAVLVFISVGGIFCTVLTEGLRTGSLTRLEGLVVLHIGLFLTLSASAFCFAVAGNEATRASFAFFSVWVALVVIAFFQFSWIEVAVALILYMVYCHAGRLGAGLLARRKFRLLVGSEPRPANLTEPLTERPVVTQHESARPEPARTSPDWAAMTKNHWKRFRPQMYAEMEKAGLLDDAADEAARKIRVKIDAQGKKDTHK